MASGRDSPLLAELSVIEMVNYAAKEPRHTRKIPLVILVDTRNAFNSIKWNAILDSLI